MIGDDMAMVAHVLTTSGDQLLDLLLFVHFVQRIGFDLIKESRAVEVARTKPSSKQNPIIR